MSFKQLAATVLMTGAVLTNAGIVSADEVSQDQSVDQTLEIECTTESYGQTRCWAKGEQSADQSQRVVLGDSVVRLADGTLYHATVDAGVTSTTMILMAGIMLSALVAGAYFVKSK